jgi:AraC family transcriptional regulator of adaptative response/methylated-DNA-[protein]-cysteine methyltransferase
MGGMKTSTSNSPGRNPRLDDEDTLWAAVVARDPAADGRFVYSVRTTGVYCKPSCPSRRALRRNVGFFATGADAARAGFRPCRRCRPEEPGLAARRARLVERACRAIERASDPPSLERLAQAAGMSRFHFHRVFTTTTGMTPRAYAAARRAERVRAALTRRSTVTEAIYEAGFSSSGRFYGTASGTLGMTPTQFRAGGAGTDIRYAVGRSSLGRVLVASTDKGVCAILMGDAQEPLVRELTRRFPHAQLVAAGRAFERVVGQVIALVETPASGTDLPLDLRGTAFQRRVWQALRAIPAGATASYTEIARRIGRPTAVRGVAQACAANPVAVVVPCHRVVRSDGSISGYRWGVERKRALLEREGASYGDRSSR